MFARWQALLIISVVCAALAGGPFANVARAQCGRGGGSGPRLSPGLLQQQVLQQQLLLQQVQQQQLLQTAQLDRQMRDLADQGPEAIKAALKDPQAKKRWMAALVVGKYGPALTDELIELLTDDNSFVRQAARKSLVRLSTTAGTRQGKPSTRRSVDFGPAANANRAAQKVAARKWRTWFEKQQAKADTLKPVSAPVPAARPAALSKSVAARSVPNAQP